MRKGNRFTPRDVPPPLLVGGNVDVEAIDGNDEVDGWVGGGLLLGDDGAGSQIDIKVGSL